MFTRDPEQSNSFMGFSPVLGQTDKEFCICVRHCFLLDGVPGYFKGRDSARPMSFIKFNCMAIWTSFGDFI